MIRILVISLALSLLAGPAWATTEKKPAESKSASPSSLVKLTGPLTLKLPKQVTLNLGLDFITLGHVYNDNDFDPTPRFYDPDGQTQGQIATFVSPTLRIDVASRFAFAWKMELGWNAWSRNNSGNPNQFAPSNQPGIMLRHKELFGAYRFGKKAVLKAGYQHFADPSRLFLDHWAGMFNLELKTGKIHTQVLLGQMPDSTYEGVAIGEDNFLTDSLVGGVALTYKKGAYAMTGALYGVADWRLVDRPLLLGTGLLGVDYQGAKLKAWFHGLFQFGSHTGTGLNGTDQSIFAWALQAGLQHRKGAFHWGANVFALSPDDAQDGNGIGSFFGSGKNNSPSKILTEDEIRDRYDNLDERIATSNGPFFLNRAGLAVLDVHAGYQIGNCYQLKGLVAAGLNLAPDNAMGGRFVGLEIGLLNSFPVWTHVSLFVNLQTFIPGTGAAVFVNDIDREATSPLFGGQFGLKASL